MANNARRGLFGLIVFQPFIVPVLVAKGQGAGGQADGERGMNRQQRFPRQAVLVAGRETVRRELEIDQTGGGADGRRAQDDAGRGAQRRPVAGKGRIQRGPERGRNMVRQVAGRRMGQVGFLQVQRLVAPVRVADCIKGSRRASILAAAG